MSAPELIKVNGQYYRLSADTSLQEMGMNPVAELVDFLNRELGAGEKDFLVIDPPTATSPARTFETYLNILHTFVVKCGEGTAPAYYVDNADKVLQYAVDTAIHGHLIPALDEALDLVQERNAKLSATKSAPVTPESPVAEEPAATLIPAQVNFRGSVYRKVSAVRVAIIQQVLHSEEATDAIVGVLNMDELKDLYSYHAYKDMRKLLHMIREAIKSFKSKALRSYSTRSRWKQQPGEAPESYPMGIEEPIPEDDLIKAKNMADDLVDQADAAIKVLRRIMKLEKEFQLEAAEIEKRDRARAIRQDEEAAAKAKEEHRRGRPPKAIQVKPVEETEERKPESLPPLPVG